MRVVAGRARGRKLVAPRGHAVRPTADRVRQATFNALESRGLVRGATVVDLYAGTGALGIEALSRGARHATFVDSSADSIAAIRANLEALDLTAEAEVVRGDALRWLAGNTFGPGPSLIFADPPYTFDQWDRLLAPLAGGCTVLVAEARHPVEASDGWQILRQQRYGSTVITVLGTVAHLEQEQQA